MPERMLDVTYSGQSIRIKLKLQPLGEVKKTLRKRFDQLDEEFSIKATIDGQENEFDITSDRDLEDNFGYLVKLHITETRPNVRNTSKDQHWDVNIDGVLYRLDAPMAEDSPLVKKYIEDYAPDEYISKIDGLGDKVIVSQIAAKCSKDPELIGEMRGITCAIMQLMDDSKGVLSGYESASCHVLHAFRSKREYITFHNGRKEALQGFMEVSTFVDESEKSTIRLIKHTNDIVEMIDRLLNKIGGDKIPWIEKKLLVIDSEINKGKRESSLKMKKKDEIENEIAAAVKREDERKSKYSERDKLASDAADFGQKNVDRAVLGAWTTFGAAGVLVAAAEASLASVAAGAAVVGAGAVVATPVFLAAGIGGGVTYASCKIWNKLSSVAGLIESNQRQRKETKKTELEKRLSGLEEEMKQLEVGAKQLKELQKYLGSTRERVSQLKLSLENLVIGWEAMGKSCRCINDFFDQMKTRAVHNDDDCYEAMTTDSFKYECALYKARWVALEVFARRGIYSLTAESTKLKTRLKHISQKEMQAAKLEDCI